MYCLFQLYLSVATELAPHRPVLKLISIKAVGKFGLPAGSSSSHGAYAVDSISDFLAIHFPILAKRNRSCQRRMIRWTRFDVQVSDNLLQTPYMTAGEINIGWGAILETFEMRSVAFDSLFFLRYQARCSIFAFVHIKAFSYKPYRPLIPNPQRTSRLRSFAHAMDFRETFRELYASVVYMCRRMRGVETDPLARRMAVLENAFDKNLPEMRRGRPTEEKALVLEVDRTVEVAVDGEKQWLGVGDNYGYGLSRRERSEALGMQFEKELEKRGYGRSSECKVPDIYRCNKQTLYITNRSGPRCKFRPEPYT